MRRGWTRVSRAGFTLLELLAVVALIALLAALIIPLVSGALDAAYQTECASNLRNLGAVYSVYAADHDYQLPSKDMLGNSSYRSLQDPLSLPRHFSAYVPTNRLWMCPRGRKTLKQFGVNYAWSRAQNLVAETGGAAAFSRAASTVVVWDNFTYALPSVFGVPEAASGGGPQAVTPALRFHAHVKRSKANYLSLDGRVELK